MILLIPASLMAHFSYFSQGFFMRLQPYFLLSGSVISSRAALSSENACYQFLCR